MIAVKRTSSGRVLTDFLSRDGQPLNLAGLTVTCSLYGPTGVTVHLNATVTDEANGGVAVTLQPTDIPYSGRYFYEWRVGGVVLPESGQKALRVVDDLG